MKVLIVGSKGQLGTELLHCLEHGRSELGAIPDLYRHAEIVGVDIDMLDIANRSQTFAYMQEQRPEIVINCAAYTNVDGCESHRDDAFAANAIGPRNLAMAAEEIGAKLLHVSTDYVFCGNDSTPKSEFDAANPINVYGKTKLAGEHYLQQFCSKWFIVRTAWLYGRYGKNFVKAIEKKARETGAVTVVDDQYGNPTNAADLAHHILKIAVTEEYGIYHCTGNGQCSWFEFAQKIIEYAGIAATVTPCTSEEYASPTNRPAYSSLDHMMLRLTVGDEMREWEEALRAYMDHFKTLSL